MPQFYQKAATLNFLSLGWSTSNCSSGVIWAICFTSAVWKKQEDAGVYCTERYRETVHIIMMHILYIPTWTEHENDSGGTIGL